MVFIYVGSSASPVVMELDTWKRDVSTQFFPLMSTYCEKGSVVGSTPIMASNNSEISKIAVVVIL